jgi:hypothetical protein
VNALGNFTFFLVNIFKFRVVTLPGKSLLLEIEPALSLLLETNWLRVVFDFVHDEIILIYWQIGGISGIVRGGWE